MPKSVATQRLKLMACSDCGELQWVGSNKRKAPLCISCAVKRAIDNNTQMQSKSGPYYEKWRAAMARQFSQE